MLLQATVGTTVSVSHRPTGMHIKQAAVLLKVDTKCYERK